LAKVITIAQKSKSDFVISKKQLPICLKEANCKAVHQRTIPNTKKNYTSKYSNTKSAYLLEESKLFNLVK